MPNKWDLSLDKYGISLRRYRELYYFCLQYNEKKNKLRDCYDIGSPYLSDMPKSGNVRDAIAKQAEIAIKLRRDIELIEQCAIAADAELYQYILKNVTEELRYEYLNVPAGRRKFYESRRKFFYLLNQKKG